MKATMFKEDSPTSKLQKGNAWTKGFGHCDVVSSSSGPAVWPLPRGMDIVWVAGLLAFETACCMSPNKDRHKYKSQQL